MTKDRRWMVRFNPIMGRRVELRAEGQGISIAEYLRNTIEDDLKKAGKADALAQLNTEITLVSGMMLRRLLTQVIGPEDAKNLEEWANGRASAVIEGEFRERSGT
jgi:carbon monoxide dehydrogenase subunit G